jgi:hypothetical protein
VNSLERAAVLRVCDQARAVGLDIPAEIQALLDRSDFRYAYPARAWAEAHPDEQPDPCCVGSANAAEDCTCWRPVFDVGQAEPRPPASFGELSVQLRMCGDCAYRPGSSERVDQFMADELFALPEQGTPFYCHDGMRRPAYWQHPDGRRVDGAPDDWQPLIRSGIPYRADGAPGLLCAGWFFRRAQAYRVLQRTQPGESND